MEFNIYDSICDTLEVKELLYEFIKTKKEIRTVLIDVHKESKGNEGDEGCKKSIDNINSVLDDNGKIIHQMDYDIYGLFCIIIKMYKDYLEYDLNNFDTSLFDAKMDKIKSSLLKIDIDFNNNEDVKKILSCDASKEEIISDLLKKFTHIYVNVGIILERVEKCIREPEMNLENFKDMREIQSFSVKHKENNKILVDIINRNKLNENKKCEMDVKIFMYSVDNVSYSEIDISKFNTYYMEIVRRTFNCRWNETKIIIECMKFLSECVSKYIKQYEINDVNDKIGDIIKDLTKKSESDDASPSDSNLDSDTLQKVVDELAKINGEQKIIKAEMNRLFNKLGNTVNIIIDTMERIDIMKMMLNFEADVQVMKSTVGNIGDIITKVKHINENINENIRLITDSNNKLRTYAEIMNGNNMLGISTELMNNNIQLTTDPNNRLGISTEVINMFADITSILADLTKQQASSTQIIADLTKQQASSTQTILIILKVLKSILISFIIYFICVIFSSYFCK